MATAITRQAPAAIVTRIDISCSPINPPNLRATANLGIRSKAENDRRKIGIGARNSRNARIYKSKSEKVTANTTGTSDQSAVAATLEEEANALVEPAAQLGWGERRTEAQGAASRPLHHHQDELLGREASIDRPQFAAGDPWFENPRDALDPGGRAEFVQDAREPGKPRRLGNHHAVQRKRLRGQRHGEHVFGGAAQRLREARPLEQGRIEGRRPALDQPPHDRLEQHLLAAKPMVEGAF